MSKILFHYAMFSNFNGIENGVFRRLSAHCIMDDSGPLKKCFDTIRFYLVAGLQPKLQPYIYLTIPS